MDKVTAFVVRGAGVAQELLLFSHPYAGVQIPAGTVELGETPEAAALREAREETGLRGFADVRYLGCEDLALPEGLRAMLEGHTVYARPDKTSFDWARLPRATWVHLLRQEPGWAQITYKEPDRLPDPQYASYQITGWVPARVLAARQRRFLYLLEYRGESPQRWHVDTDHHTFELFWAPLARLPEIIPPQDGWLRYLRDV
ncbi:MAG: NUDIX domain-containing protein [Anaerolineae bacterium]|nr:NUDIX domain-containing protein [Anaerolineae bacterium]